MVARNTVLIEKLPTMQPVTLSDHLLYPGSLSSIGRPTTSNMGYQRFGGKRLLLPSLPV